MEKPEGELAPPTRVKLLYGLGQAHDGGFNVAMGFVLFYYTAVLGLPGALVGAALFVGTCFDAAVDPFIGSWSDNIRSRFGRRVPLMAVGAPLMALFMGLLFAPPAGLPTGLLAAWLVVSAVGLRSAMSLFHVPYVALGAEMADGYAERSSIVAYRTVSSIVTSIVVTGLAYSLFFRGEGGLQRPENYPGFGWTVGALLLAGMALACVGVWRYAAALPQAPSQRMHLLRRLPAEVVEMFRNRSFRTLFFSAAICYAAIGLNQNLTTHVNVFVWKLPPQLIQFTVYAFLAGMLLGVPFASALTRRIEKKTVVLFGLWTVAAVWAGPALLRAAGIFTATGADTLPLLMSAFFLAGIGAAFCAIAYPSMMADAADEHEHLFGRRREGLYFAGLGFAFKGSAGVGILLAGLALDLMRFPKAAGRDITANLPEGVLVPLVLWAGLVPALMAVVSILIFLAYAISRRRHGEIAAALRGRRGPEPSPAE